MSATVTITNGGRDGVAVTVASSISYFKLGEGGFTLSPEVTEVVAESSPGGVSYFEHTVSVGCEHSITDVDTGAKEFEIAGLHADLFPDGAVVYVKESTGNDGAYTVAAGGASEAGGNTYVVVNETVPDTTVDGILFVVRLPIALGPSSDATHFAMVVEEVNSVPTVIQSISDTTGEGSLTGDGTGNVNYKSGEFDVTFTSAVTPGNDVRVRFKYHDKPKAASGGVDYTELESEGSPTAGDGNPEQFTYQKSFGADADTEVVVQGAGYATVRAKMKLQEAEGIDDGRGATYGGIPYYFEGGIFDENDVMVGYFTFDKVKKVAPLEFEHTFDIIF